MNFKNYRDSLIIKDHIKNPHILVGDYSYYAGYYHGHGFEECVLYSDFPMNKSKNCFKSNGGIGI